MPAVAEKCSSAPTRPKRSRAPRFVQRYRALHLTWQVVVLFVGLAIVASGVAMLALPGPGWAAIILGLIVLATEFVWAQRMLSWTRTQATKGAERALDPAARRRNLLLLAIVIMAGALAIAWYLWWAGVPAWVPSWLGR